jgi:transcription elongation factor GreA
VEQPIDDSTVWITQDARDKLQEELDHLRGPVRAELSRRIGEARAEGDLKENGGYHAAKEQQGMAEARIRQLEDILRRAKVGETPSDDGIVGPGMTVTVKFNGEDATESFLLGSRELLVLDDAIAMDVYSPQSPLGAALLGKRPGERATYRAPGGREVDVEIVDAKPFVG